MRGYDLYQVYLGIKLHFTTDSYDYFKFNGKTNTSFASYLKRSDKYWFEKLSRSLKAQPVDFFVSLFAHNPHQWIGQMMEGGHEEIWTRWQRKMENFSEEFAEEMSRISQDLARSGRGFDWLFRAETGQHPPLLQSVIRGEVSPETFIVLDEILGFMPDLSRKLEGDPVWQNFHQRCEKYRPFLRARGLLSNPFKYRRIIKQKLEEWEVGA